MLPNAMRRMRGRPAGPPALALALALAPACITTGPRVVQEDERVVLQDLWLENDLGAFGLNLTLSAPAGSRQVRIALRHAVSTVDGLGALCNQADERGVPPWSCVQVPLRHPMLALLDSPLLPCEELTLSAGPASAPARDLEVSIEDAGMLAWIEVHGVLPRPELYEVVSASETGADTRVVLNACGSEIVLDAEAVEALRAFHAAVLP